MRSDSPFRSEDWVDRRAALAKRSAKFEAVERAAMDALPSAEAYGMPEATRARLRAERWQLIRQARSARGNLEEAETIEQGTERLTERFFEPFAKGGARPEKAQIREMAEFFQRQSETSFRIHADVQEVVSQLNSNRPGNQSHNGKR